MGTQRIGFGWWGEGGRKKEYEVSSERNVNIYGNVKSD
jgi:hypothetical protein